MKRNRECEMVKDSSWYKYFFSVVNPLLDAETCAKNDKLFDNMYGDFFMKHIFRKNGPLLDLGAGYGGLGLALARKGFTVWGLDNDRDALLLLVQNAFRWSKKNYWALYADLYGDFHKMFAGKKVQACIHFGVLEHFNLKDARLCTWKQFQIANIIICMVPVGTIDTLKTFGAKHVGPHIDKKTGIYRNFQLPEYWKNVIFRGYLVKDEINSTNFSTIGRIDMTTFVVTRL